MKKATVVILNWNGEKFLRKFLPFVVRYNPSYSQIVVADNASCDNSVEFLMREYPEIRIIRHNSNFGFTKGYNEALKQIKAEYFVLLNSDIEVTENWMEAIIKQMDTDHNIAVCQPKILSYHQRTHFEYAGAAGGFIDKYGYPFCRGRIFDTLEEDKGQYDNTLPVFWATGACMFVRADIFHQTGGFDEEFFAHMEEIDLCWRIRNTGYSVYCNPQSVVFHIGGGTLPKSNPHKTYLNFRNNMLMIFKNIPAHRLWFVLPFRLVLDGIAGMKFLFTDSWKDCLAIIKAHFYFYTHLSQLIKKRKATQEMSRHNKDSSLVYQSNIVFTYYLHKIKHFSALNFLN